MLLVMGEMTTTGAPMIILVLSSSKYNYHIDTDSDHFVYYFIDYDDIILSKSVFICFRYLGLGFVPQESFLNCKLHILVLKQF